MQDIPLSVLTMPMERRWLMEPERTEFLEAFKRAAERQSDRFLNRNRRIIEGIQAKPRGYGKSIDRVERAYKSLQSFRELLEEVKLPLPEVVRGSGLLDLRGVRLGSAPGTVRGERGYPLKKRYGVRGVIFDGVDFSGARFDGAILAFSVFRNCLLDGAVFSNAALHEFVGCRMTGADFNEAWTGSLILEDCLLRGCWLTNLREGVRGVFQSRFHSCDFRKGCMLMSSVENSLFVGCDFTDCGWASARLDNNTFENCYFRSPHGEAPPKGAVSTDQPLPLERFMRGRVNAVEQRGSEGATV